MAADVERVVSFSLLFQFLDQLRFANLLSASLLLQSSFDLLHACLAFGIASFEHVDQSSERSHLGVELARRESEFLLRRRERE